MLCEQLLHCMLLRHDEKKKSGVFRRDVIFFPKCFPSEVGGRDGRGTWDRGKLTLALRTSGSEQDVPLRHQVYSGSWPQSYEVSLVADFSPSKPCPCHPLGSNEALIWRGARRDQGTRSDHTCAASGSGRDVTASRLVLHPAPPLSHHSTWLLLCQPVSGSQAPTFAWHRK